ncbi:GNAT family N-acetyltransferase [Nostoc sp. DedQUE09]|uniref:GNAT family N-acetyltransferase n=1 Tax=Nostoc sp. DedQUE09 TaxID=3075394 RepID=UPI002AD4416B|nr:GNAT family N-acetyltransferase [Nostoc sp. DedQUE09]MDZ7956101.1 GNAT family N-acetyltransferase [Nostoc sp. DedQUE09]
MKKLLCLVRDYLHPLTATVSLLKLSVGHLYSAKDDFWYQDDWWQFGINQNGDIVGFVLLVIFTGCAKEDKEKGTIYDIGVLSEYRGQGGSKQSFVTRNTYITRSRGLESVL